MPTKRLNLGVCFVLLVVAKLTSNSTTHGATLLIPDAAPYVAFFGGALDSKSKIVESLAREVENRTPYCDYDNLRIKYYEHDQVNQAYLDIWAHVTASRDRVNTPVIVVGHSWGGDSAFELTGELSTKVIESSLKKTRVSERTKDAIKVDLLVTLDAVGQSKRAGKLLRDTRNPARRWVNVYTRQDKFFEAAGRWGRETAASKNIKCDVTHGGATYMYGKVEAEVLAVLLRSIEQRQQERSGVQIGRGFASFRDITCDTYGTLYCLQDNGTLFRYHPVTKNGQWVFVVQKEQVPGQYGGFVHFLASDRGRFYGVTKNGRLIRHTQMRTSDWSRKVVRADIGRGFGNFKQLFAGADGRIYGLTREGKLLRYRDRGVRSETDKFVEAGVEIGHGWNTFQRVFEASGRIYGVSKNGDLFRYEDAAKPQEIKWRIQKLKVGEGFNGFSTLTGGGGFIYGVQNNGRMVAFRDAGR